MTNATKEMLLEGARLVTFAVLATVVTFLISTVIPTLPDTQTTAVLILLLRMVDKYIHKSDMKSSGLVSF